MDTTEMIWALLIALILGGTLAYIFWKERNKAKNAVPPQAPAGKAVNTLQLQLQAYERLVLLTERIALPNLINRFNNPGITARDMQAMLTRAVREEFDYNITQQVYVSAESWDAIKNLKEQNIHIINQVASFLPADTTGTELNRQILDMIASNPRASLHNVVAEVLSFEAKKLMR